MRVQHHQIEQDGLRWHVVTSGPEDAPPVLLLHCWTGNWTVWQKTMTYFEGRYRFIVPDHLGFGQSDKPRGDFYRIQQQAERSYWILNHFGYEYAHVMGHSMGGQMALTLAGMYPQAVEKLIVVDPAVTGKIYPMPSYLLMLPLMALARRNRTLPLEFYIQLGRRLPFISVPMMNVYFPRPSEYRDLALYWCGQITADGQAQSSAWAQKAVLDWDVTPLLPSITAPTLALWGEQDYCVAVSECDVLKAHIRNFQEVRFPRVGHMPMVEVWEQYISQVEQFWA
ncbi:MAG TPA: alpha/beta hydrolase [Phototrophicaceae bacterium]|nr:alpha/beta hydrolase [Phototrophicaceae bacterium]